MLAYSHFLLMSPCRKKEPYKMVQWSNMLLQSALFCSFAISSTISKHLHTNPDFWPSLSMHKFIYGHFRLSLFFIFSGAEGSHLIRRSIQSLFLVCIEVKQLLSLTLYCTTEDLCWLGGSQMHICRECLSSIIYLWVFLCFSWITTNFVLILFSLDFFP